MIAATALVHGMTVVTRNLASSTAVENAAAAEYQDKNDDDEQSLGGHAVIVSGRRPDYCRIADSSGQA